MLVGSVIRHEVENDFDVVRFGLRDEIVEIGQRAVHRIDRFVVRNVVAEIDLRRREARRDPDRIDAKVLQIVELRRDAFQIADAVAVAVGKAPRIDLVEHGVVDTIRGPRRPSSP